MGVGGGWGSWGNFISFLEAGADGLNKNSMRSLGIDNVHTDKSSMSRACRRSHEPALQLSVTLQFVYFMDSGQIGTNSIFEQ